MARPEIEPVTRANLAEFAAFLHEHLDSARSVDDWIRGLVPAWSADAPNHGFLMRDGGAIVGGIGAIYAMRTIDGRDEGFCNITSWCVLDSHRQHSMRLAMSVVSQRGWHFTDFSPTATVAASLQFLKFKPLDDRLVLALNLPWLSFGETSVRTHADTPIHELDDGVARDFLAHRDFPWLHHLFVGGSGRWCHVIYRRDRVRGLPAARVIHASDRELLRRGWRTLAAHLLRDGCVVTLVEWRLLGAAPAPCRVSSGYVPRVFLSETIPADRIDYLYSEQVALEL